MDRHPEPGLVPTFRGHLAFGGDFCDSRAAHKLPIWFLSWHLSYRKHVLKICGLQSYWGANSTFDGIYEVASRSENCSIIRKPIHDFNLSSETITTTETISYSFRAWLAPSQKWKRNSNIFDRFGGHSTGIKNIPERDIPYMTSYLTIYWHSSSIFVSLSARNSATISKILGEWSLILEISMSSWGKS